jgi:hypothetical protein
MIGSLCRQFRRQVAALIPASRHISSGERTGLPSALVLSLPLISNASLAH